MIEIFPFIFKYLIILFNCVLLTKYYSSFLLPKNKDISLKYTKLGFGVGCFISQYLIECILASLPIHIALSIGTIALCILSFILALFFFEPKIKTHIFLLGSFFAIREIGLLISFSIFSLIINMNTTFLNILIQYSILTSLENQITFINIFSITSFIIFALLYIIIFVLSLWYINKIYLYKYRVISLSELIYLMLPCFSGFTISVIIKVILYKPGGDGITMLFKDIPYMSFLMPLVGFILLFSLLATIKIFHKLVNLYIVDKEKAVLHRDRKSVV